MGRGSFGPEGQGGGVLKAGLALLASLILGQGIRLWVRRTVDRELRAEGLELPRGLRIEELLVPPVCVLIVFTALHRWGDSPSKALFFGSFLLWLVAISAVDLRTHIIPDEMVFGGLATGVLFLALGGPIPWSSALIGLVSGFGIMLALAIIGRGSLGGGDVKLGALLGLHLGWPATGAGLVVSFVAGSVVALALLLLRIKGKRDFIPYGPFFAVGSAAVLILS